MVVSGFAQIQAQLQYRASGCSMGLPVVVGTSRVCGVGGGVWGCVGVWMCGSVDSRKSQL